MENERLHFCVTADAQLMLRRNTAVVSWKCLHLSIVVKAFPSPLPHSVLSVVIGSSFLYHSLHPGDRWYNSHEFNEIRWRNFSYPLFVFLPVRFALKSFSPPLSVFTSRCCHGFSGINGYRRRLPVSCLRWFHLKPTSNACARLSCCRCCCRHAN